MTLLILVALSLPPQAPAVRESCLPQAPPVRPKVSVTIPDSTIAAAVALAKQPPAPVAAPVVAPAFDASPCANGQCGVQQRRGLFGRRR